MAGKTVLITGANSGIGFAIATELAKRGDEIVMVCRDADRAAAALAQIHQVAKGPLPSVLLADLSSQTEIHALVAQVRARLDHIDVTHDLDVAADLWDVSECLTAHSYLPD